MKPRIVTKIGEYEPQEWDGVNRSGIRVLGEEVLILPDKAPEKSAGGIILTESTKGTHSLAAQTGVIVHVGADAWTWNRSRTKPFMGTRPEPGDRVIFDRYGGTVQVGLDGREYFIMSDLVIGGIFTNEINEESV